MQPATRGPNFPHPSPLPSHPTAVNPLRILVDAFVNTFGITQPAPEAEARAGRYIALMLGAVLLLLGVAAWLLHGAFTH